MNQLSPALSEVAGPRLQRAQGVGQIRVGVAGLQRLYQDGCAKIRLPRDPDASGLEAVLINTAGGLTGGDRLAWSAEAEAGARLTLTTQACERIYRASSGAATMDVRLTAGDGAEIHWLPQETLLFDRGALARSFEVDLAGSVRVLAVEAVVLGRTAMGERVHRGMLRDRWRVRRAGRLIFADDVRLEGEVARIASATPVLGGACAFASLLLAADDAEARLDTVRAAIGAAGGASAFGGKLFARIVAADGRSLRRVLIPALEAMRGAALPRVWRT